jgi:hypothetical protein
MQKEDVVDNFEEIIDNIPGAVNRAAKDVRSGATKITHAANKWLRVIAAFFTLWPAAMIIVASFGDEYRQFTLPQETWFFVVSLIALIVLIACAALQFFFGSRRSGKKLCALFLALAIIPFWAMLHQKTVFKTTGPIESLMFLPFLGLIVLAIWNPIQLVGISLIPGIANALFGTAEAVGKAAAQKANKALEVGDTFSVPHFRVPSTEQLVTRLLIFFFTGELLGIYLCKVPIGDEPMLILPLVIFFLMLAWLTIKGLAPRFRKVLWVAIAVITLIFCVGGYEKAKGEAEKKGGQLVKKGGEAVEKVRDRLKSGGAKDGNHEKPALPDSGYRPNAICPMPPTGEAPYVNPNDHRRDPKGEFTVDAPRGCFSSNEDWVMPATNRGSWIEEIWLNGQPAPDDPSVQVAIWFSGESRPRGPFTQGTFPHDYHSNAWRLQAVGEGKISVRYVYNGR